MEARWNILFLSLFDDIMVVVQQKSEMTFNKEKNIVKYFIPFTARDLHPIQCIQRTWKYSSTQAQTMSIKIGFKHCEPCKSVEVCSQELEKKSVFLFHFHLSWYGSINCQSGDSPSSCFLHYIYVNILWIYFLILTVMKFLHFYTNKSIYYSASTAFERAGVAGRSNMNQSSSLI